MRAYTVATAAVALRVTPKLIDNLLSHHQIHGVTQSRQGVSRRLTPHAIVTLEVALRLTRVLSIPMRRSLTLAGELLASSPSAGRLEPDAGISFSVDLASIQAQVSERLAHAVEVAPVPRRGRPSRV